MTYRYWATNDDDKTIYQRTVMETRYLDVVRTETIQKAVDNNGKAYCQDSQGYVYKLFPLK